MEGQIGVRKPHIEEYGQLLKAGKSKEWIFP